MIGEVTDVRLWSCLAFLSDALLRFEASCRAAGRDDPARQVHKVASRSLRRSSCERQGRGDRREEGSHLLFSGGGWART